MKIREIITKMAREKKEDENYAKDENVLLVMYRNNLIVKLNFGFFPKKSSITLEPCLEIEVNIGGFDEFGIYHEHSPKNLKRKIRFSANDKEKLEQTLNSIIELVKEKEIEIRRKFFTLKKMAYDIGIKLYSNQFRLLHENTDSLKIRELIDYEKNQDND